MSIKTGHPLMRCDSGLLTVERTAGATALAVEHLAQPESDGFALIGNGALGFAHLRHLASGRAWKTVRVYSPEFSADEVRRDLVKSIDPRVVVIDKLNACATRTLRRSARRPASQY
ncbi:MULTISPECIES: hypothetical protein [unclassified Burkholderia]|uniref:hypothetical protein n=1 Tax=unclassified Burkholderia TaxID=2613784 RepID=UPI000F584A54|nr:MULTISPECIES: hypothetical protein [unclassified Burkholderia]RQR68746.1 hypothetical protein DIE11_34395 [Burkholderia sp. Bp9012]RQR70065.1 hypothetical protein DIE10_36775 [Burkholderia sp. Bp9011]RQR82979.1 hypothetical protein DIE09_36890 [Burkholderia sp. Bp9010]RQZ39409.1 hypothetical protein DIE17_34565 [Burkholderia sp. Bp9099]